MDDSDKLAEFINITGVDQERARFYLESSAGELEVAISRFYENDGEIEPQNVAPVEDATTEPDQPQITPPTSKPKPKSKNTNARFATVHMLNSSSEDDEEEGQAFYAGGSEHSGQQILGPSKKKKDIVADMFKSVQEHGVEVLDQSAAGTSSCAFRGTGYKLGQSETDSEKVAGVTSPPKPVQVTLKLWRDGFSLNDGELRAYADPANKEFLDSVRHGEIPRELRQGNSEVHLSMEDHRVETYNQAEGRLVKPFSGHGYTLGSPAPPVIGATRSEDHAVNEQRAIRALAVDPALPTTNLQIRLADGSRLLGQFNHDHTLGQVRSFIMNARPQYETRNFMLLSTYPSRELDDSETIAKAGLLNSAIMQKLK